MSELKLPVLGENLTQGTVTKIMVKTGDTIAKGQSILELETDKAVLEVPSTVKGVIKEILVKAGDTVAVDQPIFTFEDGAAASNGSAPAGALLRSCPPSMISSARSRALISSPSHSLHMVPRSR